MSSLEQQQGRGSPMSHWSREAGISAIEPTRVRTDLSPTDAPESSISPPEQAVLAHLLDSRPGSLATVALSGEPRDARRPFSISGLDHQRAHSPDLCEMLIAGEHR